MIQTRILPDQFSIGVMENGNAGLIASDTAANTQVVIELSPEAWKQLIQNAPRLKGVGIPIVGRAGLAVVGDVGGNGESG